MTQFDLDHGYAHGDLSLDEYRRRSLALRESAMSLTITVSHPIMNRGHLANTLIDCVWQHMQSCDGLRISLAYSNGETHTVGD
jgi:hypothetical protein